MTLKTQLEQKGNLSFEILQYIFKINREEMNNDFVYKYYPTDEIKEILISNYKEINSLLSQFNKKELIVFDSSLDLNLFKLEVMYNIFYLFDKNDLQSIFQKINIQEFNLDNSLSLYSLN